MSRPLPRLLLPATLATLPALANADVTAEQVWKSWKAELDLIGAESISIGSERVSPDAVTIENMQITLTDPDIRMLATLESLRFTANGDGTVDVILPPAMPVTFTAADGSPSNRVTLSIGFGDMAMTASGDTDSLTYDLATDRTTLAITEAVEDGEPIPVTATVFVNDLGGTYSFSGNDPQVISYDLAAGSIDLLMEIADESDLFNITSQFNSISVVASATLPEGFDPNAPEAAIAAGLAGESSYSYGPSKTLVTIMEDGLTHSAIITGDGGGAAAAINGERLAVSSSLGGLNVEVSTMMLPAPVTISLGNYNIALNTPLARSLTPEPFSAALGITDLVIDDMLWGMIDPAGSFDNGPISAEIALSGTLRLLFDLLDPEQAEMMLDADMPAELHGLSIDALRLSGVGAEVTGSGAFELDYTRPGPIPDMPSAQGSAILEAIGLNALLEKLAALGMLPEDQVMGARMMLGMFANVVGPDQLRSTLEINEQGHVIVNGQRIQ